MNLWEILKTSKGLPPPDLETLLFARKISGQAVGGSTLKTLTASGYPCVLEGSTGMPVLDYKIYGNSVQDGTPSPENPIEVQSVGELVTEGEFSGKYVIPVVVSGKNLINPQTTINGYRLGSDGNLFRENSYTTTDFIKVIPSKFYTRNIGFTVTNPICEYDANKTFIRRVTNGTDIMLSPDAHYVRTAFNSDYLSNIQLELGTESTAYEPYHEPVTTNIYLDEPLRKIGDYADVIDFERGVVERNIKKVVFDGSEEFKNQNSIYDSEIKTMLCNTEFIDALEGNYILSSHFTKIYNAQNAQAKPGTFSKNSLEKYKNYTYYNISNKELNVVQSDSTITKVSAFRSYLSKQYDVGTPVTAYYALADPTIEPISIPNIPTFDGTTVISTDAQIQPSNMEIKFKARK